MLTEAKSVLITGAAGAIGSALAQVYAAPGIQLGLGDINAPGLEEVATSCRTMGAAVDTTLVGVTDRQAMAAWFEGAGAVDLAISLAVA